MDSAKVEALIHEVCQVIGGEWLLVGGSLVQVAYDGGRATEDIDLISIRHPNFSEVRSQDELFKAAFRLGLDPESVNSAARFFVSELKGWESEVVEFRRGPVGCVYKPSLALFVAMKLRRGTENDLSDIRTAVVHEGALQFNEDKFNSLVDGETKKKFAQHRASLGL